MKEKEITNWEQVYQLPIKYDGTTYAWSKNNNMTLMFERSISEKDRILIVDAINGESNLKIENLTFDDCDFFLEGGQIFCVRGWGNLIGQGGLNLSEDKATEIQDGFINHVFKSLAYKDMPFYIFESKYPDSKNFTEDFKEILKELNIQGELLLSATRYAYNNSDNTSWILNYKDKELLEIDREKLLKIKYEDKDVFNISGNGYGTGLYVTLDYHKIPKHERYKELAELKLLFDRVIENNKPNK